MHNSYQQKTAKSLYRKSKFIKQSQSSQYSYSNQQNQKNIDSHFTNSYGQESQNRSMKVPKKKKIIQSPRILQNWEIFSFDLSKRVVVRQSVTCRSLAWVIFRGDPDGINAWCRICGQVKRARLGNTTILLHHIQLQHRDVKLQIDKKMGQRQQYPNNIINLCQDITLKIKNDNIEIEYNQQPEQQNYLENQSEQIETKMKPTKRSKQNCQMIKKRQKYQQHIKIIKNAQMRQNLNFQQINYQKQAIYQTNNFNEYSNYSSNKSALKISRERIKQSNRVTLSAEQQIQSISHIPQIQKFKIKQKQQVICVVLTTQQCTKYLRIYGNTILLYFCYPQNTHQLIIYACGASKTTEPIIFAIGVIYKDIQNSFRQFLAFLNNVYENCDRQWPATTFLCAHKSQISAFESFQQQKMLTTKLVFLSLDILKIKQKQRINFFMAQSLITNFLTQPTLIRTFIGFILTPNYMLNLNILINEYYQSEDTLQTIAHKLVSNYQCAQYKQKLLFQASSLYSEQQLYKISKSQQLKKIRNKIDKTVYHKLCICYLYSQYSLHLIKSSNENQNKLIKSYNVFEINNMQPFNFKNQIYKVFKISNKWKCKCGIQQLVDLPCPHIIKVLIQEGQLLDKYIGKIWKQEETLLQQQCPKIKIQNQYEGQLQLQARNDTQNKAEDAQNEVDDEQQLGDKYLEAISNVRFMQIFWS